MLNAHKIIIYYLLLAFEIIGCNNSKSNKYSIYENYLSSNLNIAIPETKHRYIFISAKACPGCMSPVVNKSLETCNDSSITVIISGTLAQRLHIDSIDFCKNIWIDKKNKIDRLNVPNEFFVLCTSKNQVDSISLSFSKDSL